jgi:hypothetical protein
MSFDPRSRWPDSSLLLCGARPAVDAALTRPGLPRSVPVYDTVNQELAQARSRPPFLRERLGLVKTLDAFTRRDGSSARCVGAGSWRS